MQIQAEIYAAALAAANDGWTLTVHARRQAAAKGIHPYTVLAAAGSPTVTYAHGAAHPGQWRYIAHGIVAVVDPKVRRIITAYVNIERTALRADQA